MATALQVVSGRNKTPKWVGEGFSLLEKEIGGELNSATHLNRQKALARLLDQGFPTLADEEWKYTNCRPIIETPFAFEPHPQPHGLRLEDVTRQSWLEPKAARLVFVNGFFAPELSHAADLPPGISFSSLAAVLQNKAPANVRQLVEARLESSGLDQPFVLLNNAFLRDGAVLHLEKGRQLNEPIEILHVAVSRASPFVVYPRLLIVAEEGSQAWVLERYIDLGGEPQAYFTNSVAELMIGENASLHHISVQEQNPFAYHVNRLQAQVARNGRFYSHTFSLGGKIIRNDLNAVMNDSGAESYLLGLYLGTDEQHIDNHTLIDHAKPHCFSDELFKGILAGRARGVFNGKIVVRPDAQKTRAFQSNKNLLLSDEASIDTKPQLEIFADDVKCTHGATVGQLDEQALFYLRARGISKSDAEKLLVEAFGGEIVQRVAHEALRSRLSALLLKQLSGLAQKRHSS